VPGGDVVVPAVQELYVEEPPDEGGEDRFDVVVGQGDVRDGLPSFRRVSFLS
jgi:hypothetical protein